MTNGRDTSGTIDSASKESETVNITSFQSTVYGCERSFMGAHHTPGIPPYCPGVVAAIRKRPRASIGTLVLRCIAAINRVRCNLFKEPEQEQNDQDGPYNFPGWRAPTDQGKDAYQMNSQCHAILQIERRTNGEPFSGVVDSAAHRRLECLL